VRKHPGAAKIDAVATHRDAFFEQQRALLASHGDAPVGADDTMPREVNVGGRKNAPDQARRAWIDVAIGADETGRDGTNPTDDALRPRLGAGDVALRLCGRTSLATPGTHGV
jgi:hypothetical protein